MAGYKPNVYHIELIPGKNLADDHAFGQRSGWESTNQRSEMNAIDHCLPENRVAGGHKLSPITLALTAHDSKKDEMVMLVKSQYERLKTIDLVATKGTGQLIKARTGLDVSLLEEGRRGGDQQVGAMVASGEVGAVIFLHDSLTSRPNEPCFYSMLHVCDIHNVPLATNLTTARAFWSICFMMLNLSVKPQKPGGISLWRC